MENQSQSHDPSAAKKLSIDDIISNITSDFQSYQSRYMALENPRQSTDIMWQQVNTSYENVQSQNSFYNSESINVANNSQYILNDNQFTTYVQPQNQIPGYFNYDHQLYRQQQQQQHQHMNYNTIYQQSQYTYQSMLYQNNLRGFSDAPRYDASIENLVESGSQIQNNGGLFNPFGNQPFQMSREMIPERGDINIHSHNVMPNLENIATLDRNIRMVAEVHPMRPSYSDVLAKSPAVGPVKKTTVSTPVEAITDENITSKVKTTVKKKNSANFVKGKSGFRRQNSSANSNTPTVECKKNDKKTEIILNNSNEKVWTSSEDLNSSKYYKADENAYGNVLMLKSKENNKKDKTKIKHKTTTSLSKSLDHVIKSHKNDVEKRKSKKTTQSIWVTNVVKKDKLNNDFCKEHNEPNNVNTTAKFDETEKSSVKPFPNIFQQQQTATTSKIQDSRNKGSRSKSTRSAPTFTALPFKTRYQRVTKKQPRNSVINTMSMINKIGIGVLSLALKLIMLLFSVTKHLNFLRAQFALYVSLVVFWFVHLLWNVINMSLHLLLHLSASSMTHLADFSKNCWKKFWIGLSSLFKNISHWVRIMWIGQHLRNTLQTNIPLPTTGEQTLKRLLACKGKDPYSILGVTVDSSEDDIKKYYKRQAVFVHPNKNNQSGAEEAFKILTHAFNMIDDPEKRKLYDSGIEHIKENYYEHVNKLLNNFHEIMATVNIIRCNSCGKHHRKELVSNRTMCFARFCMWCNKLHSARDDDIWSESRMFGFRLKYFGCMDGKVYDITEWATCQPNNMKNMRANSHYVQYKMIFEDNQQMPEVSSTVSLQPIKQASSPTLLLDFHEFTTALYEHPVPGSATNGEFRTTAVVPQRRTRNKRKN